MPRDLAGLAALGTLGYMLANRNKGADRDTDTGVDVQPSYAKPMDELEAANQSQDAMDIRDSLMRGAPGTSETVTPSAQSLARVQKAVRGGSGITPIPTSKGGKKEDFVQSKSKSNPVYDLDARSAPEIKSTSQGTYRDLSGKVQKKMSQEDRDAEMAARRESVMSGLRGIGSSISDLATKARQNYQSTLPVSRQVQRERDQAMARGNLKGGGKVVKMAKGGVTRSSASSRADGIATKGYTKGRCI